MAAVNDVLNKLLEKTNENKIPWDTTADEDAFVAPLGNVSVMVDSWEVSSQKYYIMRILNNMGTVIESLDSDEGQVYPVLEDLYVKARRVALGTDSQLDELLTHLDEV